MLKAYKTYDAFYSSNLGVNASREWTVAQGPMLEEIIRFDSASTDNSQVALY